LFAILLALAGPLLCADAPTSRLGAGIAAYNLKDSSGAIAHLKGLRSQIPRLADYATYYLASSQLNSGAVDDAVAELGAYRTKPVASSPLGGKIVLLHARSLLEQKRPASDAKALEILRAGADVLPQPDGNFALGRAAEATGDLGSAAVAYQKVWYGWPTLDLAEQASTALERLRGALGTRFPDATPAQRLDRARKTLEAKAYAKARTEFIALAAALPIPERDEAAASVGAAQYLAGDAVGAVAYLQRLRLSVPDAEARRLAYLVEAAVRAKDGAQADSALAELGQRFVSSRWRLRALLAAGKYYAQTGEPEKYGPLFRTAFTAFPNDSETCPGHWRLVWDGWVGDKPERELLLREHVQGCTTDTRTGTALYFLGRLAETEKRLPDARAYYQWASQQYSHYFYGTLARQRMAVAPLAGLKPSADASTWLDRIEWPEHRDFSAMVPNPATKLRVERARLLMAAGLADLADSELRFGATTGNEQTAILALELARSVPSPFHAMRVMKSFSSDYLAMPFDRAPRSYWLALFPLPYKDELVRNATARGLDPYLVAALIRQETEFNPDAKSPVNALGLMQLMPSTGRELARKDGVKLASTRSLLDPAISIRLGTRYMREQLDNWNGDWVRTLAAYNAGPGRLKQWLNTIPYRDPAEFVESIPIDQTREYVQAVLRNADVYRALYGDNLKLGDVKEAYDVPPVRLTTLPLAARIPGGGVKTKIAPVPGGKPGVRGQSAAKAHPAAQVCKAAPVGKAAPRSAKKSTAPIAKKVDAKKVVATRKTAAK
jgi:soluble lytic murein transglycosylase